MRQWILGAALLAACSDTQNLGDQFTFRSPRWGVSIGPQGTQAGAWHVAIDSTGDVVAAGQYGGTVDFGTTTLTAPAGGGFWLAKRSGIDGSETWTLDMSGDNFGLDALAVDAQNAVIVAGTMGDAHDFGGQTLHGYDDAYVAKYGADGALIWAAGLGQMSRASAHDIAVSSTGRIYMTAVVNGSLHTPQGPTLQQTEVLAAYDADGTLRWVNALPFAAHVAVTSDGGIVVVGLLQQTTTLGGTNIDLTHDGDCVVAKLDPAGNFQWVRSFGEPGIRHDTSRFGVDSSDRILAAANKQGEMPTEALVDPNGVVWRAQAPRGSASANAVVAYQDLVLTAGGTIGGPVDFGAGPMVGSVYFEARDANGALVDAKAYGDPTLGTTFVSALATGPSGEIAFAGCTQQPIDFGGVSLAGPTTPEGVNLMIGILDPP